MDIELVAIALTWGTISGYLLSRAAPSVAGIVLCLHALVTARWTLLAGKTPVNQVGPATVLRLLLRITLLTGLICYLLLVGYSFTRRNGLDDGSLGGGLYFATILAILLLRLPAMRRKVVFYWRMSHEFDYAQRRERTWMLKR